MGGFLLSVESKQLSSSVGRLIMTRRIRLTLKGTATRDFEDAAFSEEAIWLSVVASLVLAAGTKSHIPA